MNLNATNSLKKYTKIQADLSDHFLGNEITVTAFGI
jgi:hypothetical protein